MTRLEAALDRRADAMSTLEDHADDLVSTAQAMAERFVKGGRLLALGQGRAATDAQHIAVEFIHPVIVGKRALPAIALVNDVAAPSRRHQLAQQARPDDIVVGIDYGEGDVADVLADTDELLTVGLLGRPVPGVDHLIPLPTDDAAVAKETAVFGYHLLWELVHLFLEAVTGEPTAEGGVEALYPFLYGGATDADATVAAAVQSSLDKMAEVIGLRAKAIEQNEEHIERAAALISSAPTALTFGNGGSSTDALDLATALTAAGGTAMSLAADAAVLTALSNDVSFDVVFARQLRAMGQTGDVAIGLSTSGDSANVLAAFDAAADMGLGTIGFSGYEGGQMAAHPSLDVLLVVPSSSVHRIQETQLTLYDLIIERADLGPPPPRPGQS